MEQPLTRINQTAWAEWTTWRRKEKKKPVSESARRKQWQMLVLYSHEVQQHIINTSIMNDWQGLFPCSNKPTINTTRACTMHDDLNDRSWAYQ